MLDQLSSKYDQARQTFAGLTAGRKVMILAGMAAVVTGFIVLLVWLNKTDYEVMYLRLSERDAGAIVAKLKEKKIPFKLTPDGGSIMVPKDMVQETRLALATEGLPSSGTVGMELFNKVSLGTTDFVQRLNYQRALQGELERTISRFNEIDRVRVHLNIPKESLFIEERREPTASVVIKLHSGRALSRAQMAGIVHLVAGSVEGLNPDNVSIVDTAGGLLYSKKTREAGGLMTADQIQYRLDMERNLADRIQTLLYRVVGPEKALASVTAELNYQQITAHELVYDPDRTAVRSEQRLTEKGLGAGAAAAGAPTTRYRLGTTPPQAGAGAGGGGNIDRTEETFNYEITRIDRNVVIPAGAVKKLSAAVIVDGTYTTTEKDGKKVQTFVPRPEAELARFEELVQSAIGYDKQRGDMVVVKSVPFHRLIEEPVTDWWSVISEWLSKIGRPALNIILIVLFFLFVARPVISWLTRETEAAPLKRVMALPAVEKPEEVLPPSRMEKGHLSRDQVLSLARQQPERTISLIRSWIDQR